MTRTDVCRCGFEGRAAVAGYARLLLAAAMAASAIAAANGVFPAGHDIAVTATLSALMVLTGAMDIVALWANWQIDNCAGCAHPTATGAWPWLFLLIAFIAAPALFAADQLFLAIALEIYVVGRTVLEGSLAAQRAGIYADVEHTILDPDRTRQFQNRSVQYAAFGYVAMLFAVTCLAAGMPPDWAESTILTMLWIVVSALLLGETAILWRDMVGDYLLPEQDDSDRYFTKEPRKGLEHLPQAPVGRAGWWLANGGVFLLVYELSLAEHTVLAVLFVPLLLMAWAFNTERRMRIPEDQRGEMARPILALHAAVRDTTRALHLAVAIPVRATRRLLRRKP